MNATTKESLIADVKTLMDAGLIDATEAANRVKDISARFAIGVQEPAAAAAAAAPTTKPPALAPQRTALEVEENGLTEEEELPTPWGICPLPHPVTPKTGKQDTSRLANINIRAIEKGEYIDGVDKKTGKAKKVWKGLGVPSGMIALDTGNQWKSIQMTPAQFKQFIKAMTATNPETGQYIIEELRLKLLATSQPQTIELT